MPIMKFTISILIAIASIATAYEFSATHPGGKNAMQAPAPRAPPAQPADPVPPSNDDSSSTHRPASDDDGDSEPQPAAANLDFGILGQNSAFVKNGQKQSGKVNDGIKGINGIFGKEVFTPLEKQEGPMRLFFTATPSVTPSPSATPTPSISPSPSGTPSVSPTASITPSSTPASTPAVTPSKSPSPTPFTDGYPPFTVRTRITIPTDQDSSVSFSVLTNSGGRVARVGDFLTCSVFVVSGAYSPTLFGSVARFAKELPSSTRFLLPGYVRVNRPDQDGRCGVALTSEVDSSTTWISPEDTNGECVEQELDIDPITVPVSENENGQVGCHFTCQGFCFSDNCPATELEFQCSFSGSGAGQTRPPVPSSNS